MASSRHAATRALYVSYVALSRQSSSRLRWAGPVAFPAAAGPPGPGGIVSDEFNGGLALRRPARRLVAHDGPGHAVIRVPSGRVHDLWAGALDAPRLPQNVPIGDFQLELKLDGVLGARYQTERIVMHQDANNLLRLEVHWDGVGTSLFAASFVERQFHGSTVHARDRR